MKTEPTLARRLTLLSAMMISTTLLALCAQAQAQPWPPTVTLQTPTNLTVSAGSGLTIAVSAAGAGPFSYQWQLNGTNLANNKITTVAGRGIGDGGPAANAELYWPPRVAVDATGNVFIADEYNNRIRKVGINGIITTVAGNGMEDYSGDGGAATNAALDRPGGIAVDATGNLFIADYGNDRIREVGTNGIITTAAGNGTEGYSGDGGLATSAQLYWPYGVAVDVTGNLFVADWYNRRIREVRTNGIITTVAGGGYNYPGDGGAATNVALLGPSDVAVDAAGNLFIADTGFNRICKVGTNGIITTVAGNGTSNGYSGDGGAATNAALSEPSGVAVDATGDLFIADFANQRIREVETNGIITTVAGNGVRGYSGDGGAATNAQLSLPSGVAVDVTGNLLIADTFNSRIREVGTDGAITTVAGNGTFGNSLGYSGDGGAATNAELANPSGVAVDATGNFYIADTDNDRIREVGTNGIITTVGGNGTNGYSGDGGAATNAELYWPSCVAADATGNLFIADHENDRIREVGTDGAITTVAGNGTFGNSLGYSGDGGAATNAELANPSGVAVDATGNFFIADTDNDRIREVGTNGIITTVAGNGTNGYSGDGGAATNVELNYPSCVAVDATGNLFIADYSNQRIREVGTNGIITTVAGNGTSGYSGDGGAATNAELNYPSCVAVDATGNLFIADTDNNAIRKVVFNSTVLSPTLFLNNVDARSAGAYDVVVSSPYGSATSSIVNVTVTLPCVLVLSAPQISAGQTNFSFFLSGPAGSNYVLQASGDLLNWNSASTSSIPISGSITLSNAVNGFNRQFYRVFLQ